MNNDNASSRGLKPHPAKPVEEIAKRNTAMKTMHCPVDQSGFRGVNVQNSALQRFGNRVRLRRKKSLSGQIFTLLRPV